MITICPFIHFSFHLCFETRVFLFTFGWMMKISKIKHFYKFLVWVKEQEPSWFCQRDPATVHGQGWEPGGQSACMHCNLAWFHPCHTVCCHSPIWSSKIPFTKLGHQKWSTKNLPLFSESHVDPRLWKYTAVQDKTDPSAAKVTQVMRPQDCQNGGRYP